MRRIAGVVVAMAVMLTAPAVARADTILTLNGLSGLSGKISQNSGSTWKGITAGAFDAMLTTDDVPGEWFDAYCVELGDSIDAYGTYNVTIGDMDAWGGGANDRGKKATYLYNAFYQDAWDDPAKQAGLQLAIWNVLYDTTLTDVSLGTGSFRAKEYGSTAMSAGNYYLGQLGTNLAADGSWLQPWHTESFLWWEWTEEDQNLIGPPNAVPEPTSMLLLGSGLFGLAGAARRRLRK